jgi:predicted Zn-dependent protease
MAVGFILIGVACITPAVAGEKQEGFFGGLIENATKLEKSTRALTRDEERELGQDVAKDVFKRFGPMVQGDQLRYVTLVGRAVAAKVNDGRIYRFALINSPQVNAFAAPGGYVFITTGLLGQLQDEAELAGVLAHEISHAHHEHMVKSIQRANKISGGTQILGAITGESNALRDMLGQANDILYTKGLEQEFEFEADHSGVTFAAMAGYDPQGLRRFLTRLNEKRDSAESIFFTTHPPASARIAKVDGTLSQLGKGGATLQNRFAQNLR